MRNVGFMLLSLGIALGLFVAMLLSMEVGQRLGARRAARYGTEAAKAGVGAVDGPIFALVALLIGFTFNGAAARFDHRRELVVDEVVAIRTAWHRLEMLPAENRSTIRDKFRHYLDAQISTYAQVPGTEEERLGRDTMTRAEEDLWKHAAVASLADNGEKARMLVLPALNQMFDVVHNERLARRIHPPRLIWVMLCFATLAASLFAGYGMATGMTRNWIYRVGASATIAIAIFVILELESPRLGLIRMESMDRALVELRATME